MDLELMDDMCCCTCKHCKHECDDEFICELKQINVAEDEDPCQDYDNSY